MGTPEGHSAQAQRHAHAPSSTSRTRRLLQLHRFVTSRACWRPHCASHANVFTTAPEETNVAGNENDWSSWMREARRGDALAYERLLAAIALTIRPAVRGSSGEDGLQRVGSEDSCKRS